MGLLNNLMSKIFGHASSAPATAPGAQTQSAAAPEQEAQAPVALAPAAAPPPVVDVTSILNDLAKKNPERLDWKRSIVDLMKLVGMDSSFAARKQLAAELHYSGDPNEIGRASCRERVEEWGGGVAVREMIRVAKK